MVAKNPRSRIVSSSVRLATGRPHPGMVVEAARMEAVPVGVEAEGQS